MLATTVGTVKGSFEAKARRFIATGQPTAGFASVPFRYDGSTAAGQDAASAVAVTPARQIIIAGYENLAPSSFGVERLSASGTPIPRSATAAA